MKILVWGTTRDLLAGTFPKELVFHEVQTLDQVLKARDAAGTLVLADVAHVQAQAQAIADHARGEAAGLLVWLVVGDSVAVEALLSRAPFVHDWAPRPLTPPLLELRLRRTLETLQGRRVVEQLDEALRRRGTELHELNTIGVALSAERDIDALLRLILAKSREITRADAGSLYLVERGKEDEQGTDDQLRFKLAQNDSLSVFSFQERAMPLDESSIAGYVALTGTSVNVADAYDLPAGTPYGISRSFDLRSGYRTKSMLVVPMRDYRGQTIGVVQLINKKRARHAVLQPLSTVEQQVVAFSQGDEELVSSLASQAAVALENTRLIRGIKDLFDAFVRAAVTAIEARDPTTSGHSERVALLTVGLAEAAERCDQGPLAGLRFSRDQIQEIRYASLLHDFGKVGVREKVLIKGKKLYVGEVMLVRQRFAYIKRTLEAEHLRAKLEHALAGRADPGLLARLDADYAARLAEIDLLLRRVMQANEPSIVEEQSLRVLLNLSDRQFVDADGQLQPYLTPDELEALSIRRGSLSPSERRQIESHVTHTYRFLAQIPWTGEYRRVPEIAYAHHEKLDGSGYPRGLRATEIPVQSRMMTITDIFDALVAWDRPYKKAVSPERALDILREEAAAGKLDTNLLELFIAAKVYACSLPRTAAEVGG
jgi:HD-GYP domain-containing protein (c-di-GMP phosphodiesterase class II)